MSTYSIVEPTEKRNPNQEEFSGRKSHRKHLPSNTAHLSGYFSKSHWAKLGWEVVEVEEPVLAVAKSWTTTNPQNSDIVLEYGYFEYLVTTTKFCREIGCRGCWPVYAESETRSRRKSNIKELGGLTAAEMPWSAGPTMDMIDGLRTSQTGNRQAKVANNSSSQKHNQDLQEQNTPLHSPLPLTTLPNDGEAIVNSELKSNEIPELTSNRIAYTLNNNRGNPDLQVKVYFPENFNWDNYPELAPYRSSFMWWTHKLHERRFVNIDSVVHGTDDFIPIKSAYARELDPDFRHLVRLLLDKGIWERDFYIEGEKCYGYRFSDAKLRHAKRCRDSVG